MWFTYIIYSVLGDKYYVGHTDDFDWRLERHNACWGKYTKRGIPWKLVYFETFETKSEAINSVATNNFVTREQEKPNFLEKLGFWFLKSWASKK